VPAFPDPRLPDQSGPRSHGPQTAQVMPLPGAPSPKRFTNRISPSPLKQAPANSLSFSTFTANVNGSPLAPSPTRRLMSVKPAASGWVSASPNRALEEAAATRPEALVCVLHAEVSQELNGSY